MKKFNFSYDQENDDLFIYLEGAKSAGAIELGSFVFDLDRNENLIAIQIFEASQVLSKLLKKSIEISQVKEFRTNLTNFRNMAIIKLEVSTNTDKEEIIMPIPRIKEKSPALNF
jgi:uncharacterized protein YuzE